MSILVVMALNMRGGGIFLCLIKLESLSRSFGRASYFLLTITVKVRSDVISEKISKSFSVTGRRKKLRVKYNIYIYTHIYIIYI